MPQPLIAIVGGETLLGRELLDVFTRASLPVRVKLIGAQEEGVAIITQHADEPVFVSPLEQQEIAEASIVVLAGSPQTSRKVVKLLARLGHTPTLIDCTYTLEDQLNARLRAPLAETEPVPLPPDAIHVVAHPASTALALFFARLRSHFPIVRSSAHIFEPATERGQAGIEELQKQTVNLFSFKDLPKDIYDAQLAFNLLVRCGAEAKFKLDEVEARIDRHLASLLASLPSGLPMPSLRLIQAPVFHGYSFSIWVEFDQAVSPETLGQALACSQIEIREPDQEVPTNAGTAGQSGLSIGAIEPDRNNPRAAWLWMVADNLRLTADNAALLARSFVTAAEGGAL